MRKIAVISDIHGNTTALNKVLEDCEKENITDYFILGDLIMPGTGSSDMLKILRNLPNALFVKGNWDDYIFRLLNYEKNELINPTNIYGAMNLKYHFKYLTKNDKKFIENLPISLETTIEGINFFLCHHMPNKNTGNELLTIALQENFDKMVENLNVDVAVYGHIHKQVLRYNTNYSTLIVNPGAVSGFNFDSNIPNFLILEVDDGIITETRFKKVKYNFEDEINFAKERNFPYLNLYEKMVKKGVLYTHKYDILDEINKANGYIEEALNFLGFQN